MLLPLGLQLLIIASLYTLQNEAETEAARADRSRFIVQTSNQICLDIYNGILQARESLAEGNVNEGYKHIAEMVNTATASIAALKDVVASDADQYDALLSVEKRLHFIRDGLINTRKLALGGDLDASVESGKKITLQARRDSKAMIETMMSLVIKEREISENSPQKLEILRERVRQGLLIAILADVALACGLVSIFGNTIAVRLKHLQENSFRLATDKPLLEPLRGSDEIAQVDKRFREMAIALTELRKKERALVENASEVICSVDKDMKFSAVNHACEGVLGYTVEELLGTRIAQIIQADDVDKTIAAMDETKNQSEARLIENRILRKTGEPCDFSWSVQWSDVERSYFCVVHDISERKELERLKKEFVDMVSHDLRAPLFSIQAFHQMLDSGVYGDLSTSGEEVLKLVDNDVTRLIDLVSGLIDIDRLESGSLELALEDLLVAEIFEDAKNSVLSLAQSRAIKLQISGETAGNGNSSSHSDFEELSVRADQKRIVQVVINLLSNAIKFSPPDSTILMTAELNKNFVRLCVTDRGRGIPETAAQTVFKRFEQVEVDDAKNHRGSGLGLAICKAIVEQHGGEIGVVSSVGNGSTFWFSLPHVASVSAS